LPFQIVSPEEWHSARIELLAKEKEHTRKADELAKLRTELPVVKVTKTYEFTGPDGPATLADMFQGRRQLIVYHLMYDPEWDDPCSSCSFLVDQLPKHLVFLNARDTSLVLVSRAPIDRIQAFQKRMGWDQFKWYSSMGSDFNYDYHVTLDENHAPAEYNFTSKAELVAKNMEHHTFGEQPGFSVFLKEGDDILHSYSCYGRGGDNILTTYALLDLTPLGRQDYAANDPNVGLGFKYHDEY
jgi:predicted dithiol-disulfide oxidoreductase (DUF899 family)